MSDSRWQRIEEIFHQAAELAPEARSAFLNEVCAADPSLRQEVESLLAHDAADGSTLAKAVADAAGGTVTVVDDLSGRTIGPYKVLGRLGEGGMGVVYKARDTRLGRSVALKFVKAQFSERFEREARAVAALNHPHIATLHDVGEHEGAPYLAMEFVAGKPLKGPRPVKEVIEYGIQVADALAAAHAGGIIHRDLKPANILVTEKGSIKILDFGLAKLTGQAVDGQPVTATVTGVGAGTPGYMSPEQIDGKPVDARSDIFAFGCVLYELVSGRHVFEGDSVGQVLGATATQEPKPLKGVPEELQRLIRRCLRKDPEHRLQHIADARVVLEELKDDWDSGALAAGEQASRPAFRRGWTAALAAVAVVLAAVGWLWFSRSRPAALEALGGWEVSRFRQPPAEARSYRLQIGPPEGSRFTFGSGVGGIALSPDGRTAAFVASGSGKNGLWARPLDGVAARLIAGTEGAAYPFWSPDSKSVAFFSGGKLLRVDVAGGAPLVICDVNMPRGGVWSRDGRILYGVMAGGLFQVSASGGIPSPLTKLDASRGERDHRWPQVLPGGRFFYSVQSDKPEDTGIYAASFAKPGEWVRLLVTDTNALYAPGGDGRSYLLWLRGGTLVAQELDTRTLKLEGEPRPVADPVARIALVRQMDVAVSAGGLLLYSASNTSSQFTWLDRTGRLLGVVGEPGEYNTFRVSPDGRRVVASLDGPGSTDLWLLEVERGVAGRFTSNRGISAFPIWSPDGRTILFSSGSPRNLFRKESSGAGNEQRFSQSPNNQFAHDWSRDGRWVLYMEVTPGTQRDLWVLPVTPDGKPAPNATPKAYLRTPFNEWWGRFSPEASARWVAYQSDETGRFEVYIQAFPEPRGATRISTGGGQYPQWGPGGRELFYVSLDNKLMAVSLKMGVDTVEPTAPRELFPLPAVEVGWSPYDAAADGQRFLVRATPGQAEQPLTVIVNWPALLKKGAAAE